MITIKATYSQNCQKPIRWANIKQVITEIIFQIDVRSSPEPKKETNQANPVLSFLIAVKFSGFLCAPRRPAG